MAASMSKPQDNSTLLQLSSESNDYPINLSHPQEFRHELREYQNMLNTASPRLFHSRKREYRVLDLMETRCLISPLSQNLESKQDVEDLLDGKNADPLTRYLFIRSANSRGPLACEKEQLLYTLNYYQVMPSFLHLVVSFKAREDPYMQTSFHSEVRLSGSSQQASFPMLKRSGTRIQHCFNLIGIEKNVSDSQNPWRVRQTAAYHSFDVVENRSLWIVLKGDDTIRNRLVEETEAFLKDNADYAETRDGCLFANIRSHMLIFQWACQNWDEYSEHFVQRLEQFKTIAKYTPVANATRDERIKRQLEKSVTFNSIVSRSRTGTWNISSPILPSAPRSQWMPGFFKSNSDLRKTATLVPSSAVTGEAKQATSGPERDIDLDGEFSFEHLQSLHRLGDQIRDALRILEEDKRVIGEILDSFKVLLSSTDFTAHVDLGKYAGDISEILRRVDGLRRDLERHEQRLEIVFSDVDKSAVLFSEAMQYKNMRIGEFLAKQGLLSTMHAEESAAKSRKEAASIHAITIYRELYSVKNTAEA